MNTIGCSIHCYFYVYVQDKERDESFKLEITGIDCDGAKLGRICKTIVTIVDDDGNEMRELFTSELSQSG